MSTMTSKKAICVLIFVAIFITFATAVLGRISCDLHSRVGADAPIGAERTCYVTQNGVWMRDDLSCICMDRSEYALAALSRTPVPRMASEIRRRDKQAGKQRSVFESSPPVFDMYHIRTNNLVRGQSIVVESTGFPFRCATVVVVPAKRIGVYDTSISECMSGIPIKVPKLTRCGTFVVPAVWSIKGVFFNVIFYVVIVLVAKLTILKWCRWRRLRMGMCPNCGYPHRVGVCPECGRCT